MRANAAGRSATWDTAPGPCWCHSPDPASPLSLGTGDAMSSLAKLYEGWGEREYSALRRACTLALLAPVFLLAIPWLVVRGGASVDRRLRLPGFSCGRVNRVAGALLAVGGFALGLWSIATQFSAGRGTPLPMLPTQELVVQPPYTYCRNPMTLGTALAYLGVAVWTGSWSAVGLVLLFLRGLVAYNRRIEEKELAARFGSAYLSYKESTPFIIPAIPAGRLRFGVCVPKG